MIRDPTRELQLTLRHGKRYTRRKLKQLRKEGPLYFLAFRPKLIQAFLQKYGDQRVVQVRIGRNPITPAITKLAKVLLHAGKVMRKYNYDELFHLFLLFTMDNGKTYRIEKNSTVNVGTVPNTIHSQMGPFTVSTPIKVREWITRAETTYSGGKAALYKYDFPVNNCQAFVHHLLKGLGFSSPGIDTFVKQHTESIGSTNAQEWVRYLTNISATYNSVRYALETSIGGIDKLKEQL